MSTFSSSFSNLAKSALLAFCITDASSFVDAQSLPIVEHFTYGSGALESVSSGAWVLVDGSIGNPFQVKSTQSESGASLAYPGLEMSMGNRLVATWGGDRGAEFHSFTSAGAATYASCLVKVTRTPTPFSSTFLEFRNTSLLETRTVVFLTAGSSAGFFRIGLSHRYLGATTYLPTEYPENATMLLVIRYTENGGSNNDSSALWVNPVSLGGSAPSADLTASDSGAVDLTPDIFAFATGIGTSAVVEADELRIGASWADVTPIQPLAASDWTQFQ